MSFYETRILPRLTNCAMSASELRPYRERIIPEAEGRVLEVGVGSGLNLPLYSRRVSHVTALDPSPQLLEFARRRAETAPPVVQLVRGNAEDLPLESDSIDCITMTWTLCSIGDVNRALEEFQRVLKPGGTVLFVEHGRAPDATVRRWQDRLTPLWRRCAGNCHLNRPTADLFERGGFTFERLKSGYARGPRPLAYMYEGVVRAAA